MQMRVPNITLMVIYNLRLIIVFENLRTLIGQVQRVCLECAFGFFVRICSLDEMRYQVWQPLHLHLLSIDLITFQMRCNQPNQI